MTAIMRRELSAYFSSPIGYIYLTVFYVFAGFFFTNTLLMQSSSLSGVFGYIFTTITLFLIPVLTMRLFSEEKKNKTDQALLTAPVSLGSIVVGKFLAAVLVFALGLAIVLVYALVIAAFTPPNWPQVFANIFALLLLGSAIISIGMFISSLSENQVIAAIGSFAAAFTLVLIDSLSTRNEVLQKILMSISFFVRYSAFTSGVFNFANVLFFLSVIFLFCFFTVRVLEKRRWS